MNDIKEEEDFTQKLSFQLKCSSFTSSMHSLVRTAKSLDKSKTTSVLKLGEYYSIGPEKRKTMAKDVIPLIILILKFHYNQRDW